MDAVRLLREATDLSLAAAKGAVERRARPAIESSAVSTQALPAPVLAELSGGNIAEAIKLLRQATGLGLIQHRVQSDWNNGLPAATSGRRQVAQMLLTSDPPSFLTRESGVAWLVPNVYKRFASFLGVLAVWGRPTCQQAEVHACGADLVQW